MIKNKYGLPQKIVDIVKGDNYEYTPHRYSATEILGSVKEIILKRRYKGKVSEDVSDYINMLFGTAFHSLFETNDKGSELKLEAKASGATLSGRVDLYDNYTVTDYKTATVWKIKAQNFEDWERQVLIYAWLLKENGYIVSKGKVIAFLKDFSKLRKEYDRSYPEAQIYVHEFKITTSMLLEIEEFIFDKINMIERHIETPGRLLPEPSDDELWRTPDKYAVMKNNSNRALRVLNSKQEAEGYMLNNNGDYIEVRKGISKKLQYDTALAEMFEMAKLDDKKWEG